MSGGGLVSRILGRRGLELGRGSMSGTITLWAPLIHLFEDRGRLEVIDPFFRLVYSNCLAPSRIVASRPWPKADVLLEKID